MTEHYETLTSPDDRGRFGLKRFLPRPVPERWRVYVQDGGRRIVLEAVEE